MLQRYRQTAQVGRGRIKQTPLSTKTGRAFRRQAPRYEGLVHPVYPSDKASWSSCHQTLNLEVQPAILCRNNQPYLQSANSQGVLQSTKYFPTSVDQLCNLGEKFASGLVFLIYIQKHAIYYLMYIV